MKAPFQRFSEIKVSVFPYYSRIDGIDRNNNSKATLISTLNYGVDLKWHLILSPEIESFLKLELKHEKYLVADADGTSGSIQDTTQNISSLSIGLRSNITSRLYVVNSLGISEEIYYKGSISKSNVGLILQSKQIPRYELGLNYKIWKGDPFLVSVQGGGIILFPTSDQNYKTKLGKGFYSNLSFEEKFTFLKLSGSIFYNYLEQDTSLLKLQRKDRGIRVELIWPLNRVKDRPPLSLTSSKGQ